MSQTLVDSRPPQHLLTYHTNYNVRTCYMTHMTCIMGTCYIFSTLYISRT